MKLTKINLDTSENGKWLWKDEEETVGFLIARSGNKKAKEATNKYITPYTGRGNMSITRQEKLQNKVFAEAILLGWKGLEGDDGKPFPYSKENAEDFLNEPAYAEHRLDILEFSLDSENYRAEEIKKSGNESKPTSAGS